MLIYLPKVHLQHLIPLYYVDNQAVGTHKCNVPPFLFFLMLLFLFLPHPWELVLDISASTTHCSLWGFDDAEILYSQSCQ